MTRSPASTSAIWFDEHRAEQPDEEGKRRMNLSGMTVSMCPNECNADGCVISGKSYRAHPRKGALHANQMEYNSALRRLDDAREYLAYATVTVQAEARKIA
jgi:hypothetical protein